MSTPMAAHNPLRVSFHLPTAELTLDGATPRWSDVLALARQAEQVGFDGVTLGEHFLMRVGGVPVGGWDPWSLLAALAASTRRLTLGLFVTCTNFRNPALIAKMADTVDEISDGRLVLGLGAGWLQREFTAYGFPFDHRVGRFAEAIQVIHGLLRHGQVDFAGEYYQVRECELRPRGPRGQGPPILIGTTGPRMLRLTARYADVWDTNFSPQAHFPALQAALDGACAEEGRDPATIERSASISVALGAARSPFGMTAHLTGTAEEVADGLRGVVPSGFSQVVVSLSPCTLAGIAAFAPVLERLRQGS